MSLSRGPISHRADRLPLASAARCQDEQLPNWANEVSPQAWGCGCGYHSGVYLLDGQPPPGLLVGVNLFRSDPVYRLP